MSSVLIVEDSEATRALIRNVIEDIGDDLNTTEAASGFEALKLLPSESFDLIITDMTMPGITGDNFAQKILEIRADIPIILCTGHSDSVSPKSAKEAGVREFLMKPLARKELGEAVRRVLDAKEET